jgi:hypothetical protein
VTVKNSRTEGNRIVGMSINNTGGGASPVTVINGVFSNNTVTGANGLYIQSYGTVTLTSVRAENNSGAGVQIQNCYVSPGLCSSGVIINSPSAGGEAMVNVFNHNGADGGLYVTSGGAISLFNFFANENTSGSGVYLNNMNGTSSA